MQRGLTLARWTRLAAGVFFCLTLWPGGGRADVVVLKNGARFDGTILESSPAIVTVRSEGAVWTFSREKIQSIKKGGGQAREERARALSSSPGAPKSPWQAAPVAKQAITKQTMVSTVRPLNLPMDASRRNPAAAAAQPRVIVYGTSWCNFCRRARSYFTDRGIPYLDKDVERDPEARAEIGRKCVAAGTTFTGSVPVLDVDGEIIHGFDVERVERALQEHEG